MCNKPKTCAASSTVAITLANSANSEYSFLVNTLPLAAFLRASHKDAAPALSALIASAVPSPTNVECCSS